MNLAIVIIIMLVSNYMIHFMMTILSISIMLMIFYKIVSSNKETNKSFENKIESHQIKIKQP